MKYLLDTNVVSELRKGDRGDAGVREWLAEVEGSDLAISVLVIGEIQLGIGRLRRRDAEAAGHLSSWLARLERAYEATTLPIDRRVVHTWADLNARRSLPVIDSLQGATALVHGLTLITRNTRDLHGVGVPLLDPFRGE